MSRPISGRPAWLDFGLPLLNTCDQNDQTLGDGPGSLTYTTAPFTTPKVLSGPIDATLFTTSTTTDTDLSATIESDQPDRAVTPPHLRRADGDQRALDPSPELDRRQRDATPARAPADRQLAATHHPGSGDRAGHSGLPDHGLHPGRLAHPGHHLHRRHAAPRSHGGPAPHLLGGIYDIQRNSGAASFINLPLAPPADFFVPCGALCTATGS